MKTRQAILVFVQIFIVCLAWSYPAWADTAFISSGGAAHLLTENKSVTMQSEVVKINVSSDLIRADCCFVFVNDGPACKVRMGFPDSTSSVAAARMEPPRGAFLSYESYVDGNKVKTETVRGDDPSAENTVWHASDVEFAANEKKTVRDIYTLSPGMGRVSEKKGDAAKILTYILHTASSWRGYIENADIIITFDKAALPQPLRAVSVSTLPQDETGLDWGLSTPGTFAYKASKAPKVRGQTVRFQFADLRPSDKDDIIIFYGRMNRSQLFQYEEILHRKWEQQHAPK